MGSADPPPTPVLRAFGAADRPRPLAGGQGTSWRCGELILKPGGGPVHDWLAEALADVAPTGFRLARAVRTSDGDWSCNGWVAARYVEGRAPDRRVAHWLRVIEAGRAFHHAIAPLTRPACLDGRDDVWAVADRVAWGEHTIRFLPELAGIARRLTAALEPLGPPQLVHGDLTGNVLLSPTLPPAVIDISPYWRPPAYAEGVVVADALCWHGARSSLPARAGVPVPAVARALLFRVATTSQAVSAGRGSVDVGAEAGRYERAAAAIGV